MLGDATINNACGFYAILHCVCNVPGIIEAESPLDRFIKSPNRVAYLEDSEDIKKAYMHPALDGSSEAPLAEAEIDHHYICLVKRGGRLYILDGDMDGPIEKGKLEENEDVLTQQVLGIVREYTQGEEEGAFGLLALISVRLDN